MTFSRAVSTLRHWERLVSHSEVNHFDGSVPKEPIEENWPTTDQSEETSDESGPKQDNSWKNWDSIFFFYKQNVIKVFSENDAYKTYVISKREKENR